MRKLFLFLLIALTAVGCARTSRDACMYTETGRQKAIVAVMPVIDKSSEQRASWDLSREMTGEIRKRVNDSKKLYLLKTQGSLEAAAALCAVDPDAIQIQKNQCGAAEFLLVAELLEQNEKPYGLSSSAERNFQNEMGATMSLTMRLRLIDVRSQKPSIILQEILHQDHNIARAYLNCDYDRNQWGSEGFERTPMGIAHNKLMKEVISRMEVYIEAVR